MIPGDESRPLSLLGALVEFPEQCFTPDDIVTMMAKSTSTTVAIQARKFIGGIVGDRKDLVPGVR